MCHSVYRSPDTAHFPVKLKLLLLHVTMHSVLKSIRVHLSPGSTCSYGLVAYTLCIFEQWYTFFMGHTAIF